MIVVTGALGFIGSNVVKALNQLGYKRDIVVVDDFYKDYKEVNLGGKAIRDWVHREIFFKWLDRHGQDVECVFHLGARTDTTLFDPVVFDRLNVAFSQQLWRKCKECDIHMIYASSAAVYGNGGLGFKDDDAITPNLKALNPYGTSKLQFDQWVLNESEQLDNWQGFRFFNVFGPNEYHKGRMASVVYHGFNQIHQTGSMKLFKSHKQGIDDGQQKRDFIYIDDVVNVMVSAFQHRIDNGIYNLGTGQARTFEELILAVFQSLKIPPSISYIDMPEDLRPTYQYMTEAEMTKLSMQVDYNFTPLERSVSDYVNRYLIKNFKIN